MEQFPGLIRARCKPLVIMGGFGPGFTGGSRLVPATEVCTGGVVVISEEAGVLRPKPLLLRSHRLESGLCPQTLDVIIPRRQSFWGITGQLPVGHTLGQEIRARCVARKLGHKGVVDRHRPFITAFHRMQIRKPVV